MTKTEVNKFKQILETKRKELAVVLRNRDGIAIEKSPDALDEVQHAAERELAIRNLDRESNLLRNVRAAWSYCFFANRDSAWTWSARAVRAQSARFISFVVPVVTQIVAPLSSLALWMPNVGTVKLPRGNWPRVNSRRFNDRPGCSRTNTPPSPPIVPKPEKSTDAPEDAGQSTLPEIPAPKDNSADTPEPLEGRDFFLITQLDELKLQPVLKEVLYSRYKVYQQGERYLIFDLRRP